jgi:hypothetical protein
MKTTKRWTVLVISLVLACGGKAKKPTTPDVKTDTQMKTDGSTGGATYGGTMAPKPGNGSGGTADPCGG